MTSTAEGISAPVSPFDWSATSLKLVHSVGAYEAKTHLSRLLERVEAGESITITRHGRDIARLVPATPPTTDPSEVIAALRAARVGTRRGESSVRSMIEEGRH